MARSSNVPRLGFIGFGELAFNMARGLEREGLKELWAYDQVLNTGSEREMMIRRNAVEAGVTIADTPADLVAQVEVFFSTVTPARALEAAQIFSGLVKPEQIYADLNSCAPGIKILAGASIAGAGVSYVDVGVIGAAAQGHQVPCLFCGTAAETLRSMLAPWGMEIRVVEGPVGTASRLKMLRGVVIKGIEALMLEMLMAAKGFGLEDEMMNAMTGTFGGKYKDLAVTLMTTHAIHSARRRDEMEMVAETVREAGIDPLMTEGIIHFFAHSAGLGMEQRFNQKVPKDYREVTAVMIDLAYPHDSCRTVS